MGAKKIGRVWAGGLAMTIGWAGIGVVPAQEAGQGTAQTSGLRFNRFAEKDPATLALKPGGPTERIETIITPDNIDYVTKTYKITRGNAADIFGIVQGSVELEGGRVFSVAPETEYDFDEENRLVGVEREGTSYLVVTAPEWMIDGLDATIAMLDAPGLATDADGTAAYFTKMKHRRPSEVAALLIAAAASGFETIVPDDMNNVLYIQDTPTDLEGIMDALGHFDVRRETAMLEVKIVEIEDSDIANLGVYWDAWKEALPVSADVELFGSRLSVGGGNVRNREGTAVLTGISPQAAASFINYLVNEGKANVTSEPRIQVVQDEESTIEATTNYLYRALEREIDGVRTFVDAESNEGVVLTVRPFIGTNTINLEVKTVVSNLVGFGQDGQPIVSLNSVTSRAVLEDGESMTLAGLKRRYSVENRSKVPFLGSIPGLKWLFTRKSSVARQSELIITMTPTRGYEETL